MQLYPTPENPAPIGAACVGLPVAKNLTLRVMTARKSAKQGTVVILGGRADFLERYFETMSDLIAQGYAVAGFDWRGQGGSSRLLKDPVRGYLKKITDYDDDLLAVMTRVVLPDCPPPYYLLAHSTGGHVALRILQKRNWFTKAILTAPLIDVHYGKWPRRLAHGISYVMRGLGLGSLYIFGHKRGPMRREEFLINPLTSDRKRWNRDTGTLESTPQLGVGGPTFSWMAALFKSIRQFKRMDIDDRFCCPIMIVAAGLDRVVDNRATHEFVARVPGIVHITMPAANHEILMESDDIRQEFFAAMNSFFGGYSV
jgi:lysophospholipase